MIVSKPTNSKHFASGTECPPIQSGLLRMYSMFYCPYAQRTRIILNLKNVKHDIVNIHLQDKPDWFLKINPLGKVPTIQMADRIMYESMVTCDYLDEVYPEPALYPSDPWQKGVDKCLIEVFETKVTRNFYKFFSIPKDSSEVRAIVEAVQGGLDYFEAELTKRNSKYLSGNTPGMVDYAIFPWLERMYIVKKLMEEVDILDQDRFPKLSVYVERMMEDPAAKSTVADIDDHVAFMKGCMNGVRNYDIGVKE